MLDVLDGTSDAVHTVVGSSWWFLIMSSGVSNRAPCHMCGRLLLTYVPVKGGILHPSKNGNLDCFCKAPRCPQFSSVVVWPAMEAFNCSLNLSPNVLAGLP